MAMLGVFESVANQIHGDAFPGADIGSEVPGYCRLNVDEDGDVSGFGMLHVVSEDGAPDSPVPSRPRLRDADV